MQCVNNFVRMIAPTSTVSLNHLTLFRQGFLRVAQLGGGGGGRRKVPAAYNSKTISDNEMKLGGVVKDH